MNMLLIEGIIITAVLLYIACYALKEQVPKVFIVNCFICAAAAWLAEESCIRLYGIYAYNPVWNIFVADVPLVVIMVWPTIIHSATILSSYFLPQNSKLRPIVVGFIVLTDAMLIEPISVNFNLWAWYQPGVFGVPLIGLLGWAYFTFLSVGFFVKIEPLNRIKENFPVMIAISVIGTHLLLLITYWTLLKWTTFPIPPSFSAGAAWILSGITFSLLYFNKIGSRVKSWTLFVRLPAAVFFYILLFVKEGSPISLIVYSFAFIPPYIAMLLKPNYSNKLIRPMESSGQPKM